VKAQARYLHKYILSSITLGRLQYKTWVRGCLIGRGVRSCWHAIGPHTQIHILPPRNVKVIFSVSIHQISLSILGILEPFPIGIRFEFLPAQKFQSSSSRLAQWVSPLVFFWSAAWLRVLELFLANQGKYSFIKSQFCFAFEEIRFGPTPGILFAKLGIARPWLADYIFSAWQSRFFGNACKFIELPIAVAPELVPLPIG
jgi:hypothetical protein